MVGQKLAQHITIIAVLVVDVLAIASAIMFQNVWMITLTAGIAIFGTFLYLRLLKNKKKTRYPLMPPEGKTDVYFPRTKIPRPVVEDFRKIEEKKRKFARLRKIVQRATKPKKK